MKKSFVLNCFLLVTTYGMYAQIKSYDLSTVPENVKKNASVIMRYENNIYEVHDLDRASLKTHRIYTVVSKNGENVLQFRVGSSKFVTLGDVDIKVFNSEGKQILKFKNKDIQAVAVSDNLIDDSKTHYLDIPVSEYPVTVEYKFEQRFKGTLFLPDYNILTPGLGVEQSTYTVKVPKSFDFRYKNVNVDLKPNIKEDEKSKTYQWEVKNLPSFEYEEGSTEPGNYYPAVEFAPNKFQYDDYEGDLSSWKAFGLWLGNLYKGLDELSAERKSFFQDLVKNANTDREKAKIIYHYLQKNFRYVSIQLGIGGLRPFSADFTDKKKYGDCKALSNYMKAALKSVGIPSYHAIINSSFNGEPVDPSFPANQFNHVILCVPQPADTIWLECTSQTTDFDVLGTTTENRNALLVTENGGVLVATPKSKSSENVSHSLTRIDLHEDGSGRTSTLIQPTGYFKELMNYIIEEKKDDQKRALIYYMGFKQPDEFTIQKKEDGGSYQTAINLDHEKIPEFIAGNKMFINPRVYNLWEVKLPKSEARKQDYYFETPFEKTDTTIFALPKGYGMEAMPTPKNLTNEYLLYKTNYWYDEEKKAVYSTAKLVLTQHKIPAGKFAEIKKACEAIVADNGQKIVIKKL